MGQQFEFDKVFSPELYLPLYEDRGPDQCAEKRQRSKADAAYVRETLDISHTDRILDLACGHGRIANLLAESGYEIHGLDASAELLDIAAAQKPDPNPPAYYVGDMRSLPYRNDTFDAVYNVFNSFGYFPDEENEDVLKEVSRVLKPGGQFLLEILDREHVLRQDRDARITQLDEFFKADKLRFDPTTGRRLVERVIVSGGERTEAEYFLRLYSFTEIRSILERYGFEVTTLHGNMRGEEYTLDNMYICLVAEKH